MYEGFEFIFEPRGIILQVMSYDFYNRELIFVPIDEAKKSINYKRAKNADRN